MLDPTVIRATLLGVISTFAEWQLTHKYSLGEMYCQWFDDVYHPDTQIWRDMFSDSELGALGAFSATLQLHLDELDGRELNHALGMEEWNHIIASAKEALAAISRVP